MRSTFFTVTDYHFFPGTLATVNSVLEFHPDAEIVVVEDTNRALTTPQRECFDRLPGVARLESSAFARPGRHLAPWELKAYACCDLAEGRDVIVGIDSDCVLCAPVTDAIQTAHERGIFLGGQDGEGAEYDHRYRAYGIRTPACNPRYMSTSLFFCGTTAANRRVLEQWAECCGRAEFNGTGPCPGHGDQGVLNAVLFAANGSEGVELLPNDLWSQHWRYWSAAIDYRGGRFVNLSAGGRAQRAFHCGGAEKFWSADHRRRVCNGNALQSYPYVWYLAMLWLGTGRRWDVDPFEYLPPDSHHLADDLVQFMPQIQQVYPPARERWNELTDPMIDRILDGIPRALSLGGGSMTELFDLIAQHPWIGRYVEVGGYEGGSILTTALRFLNRDLDVYSVESFMGNKDGTMDGHPLPSRDRFAANLRRFPTLRASLIPGESTLAVHAFADGSVDFLFIDGCHETASVIADIDAWRPKLAPCAIVAGDDFGWPSVRAAVDARFPTATITPSGCVWWVRVG